MKYLQSCIITGEYDGYLLGDRVFPYQHHLLTFYPEPGPQQSFNVAHSRTRAKVEMTIGMFKAQFQCLRSFKVTPERACDTCDFAQYCHCPKGTMPSCAPS